MDDTPELDPNDPASVKLAQEQGDREAERFERRLDTARKAYDRLRLDLEAEHSARLLAEAEAENARNNWRKAEGECDRLRAEVERLREACASALRWVARNTPLVDDSDPMFGPVAQAADEIRAKLAAALAGPDGARCE